MGNLEGSQKRAAAQCKDQGLRYAQSLVLSRAFLELPVDHQEVRGEPDNSGLRKRLKTPTQSRDLSVSVKDTGMGLAVDYETTMKAFHGGSSGF